MKYEQTQPPQVITPPQVTRQYLHTVGAGAWLPFLQATITALVLGLGSLTLAIILEARHPEKWGLVIGVLAWTITWLLLQRHWFSLTNLEKLIGMDINQDGQIGQSAPSAPPEIRVRLSQVKDNGHFQEKIFTLHGTPEQLYALAHGLIKNNISFSERQWTGAGRPFSVDEFRSLRSAMIRNQMLTVANPKDARQGYVLTETGIETMKRILEASPSPTPPMEDV